MVVHQCPGIKMFHLFKCLYNVKSNVDDRWCMRGRKKNGQRDEANSNQ